MRKLSDFEIDLLAPMYDRDFAIYIERFNARARHNTGRLATLRDVCRRFRLTIEDARLILERSTYCYLSSFAYKPPEKGAQDWGVVLLSTWYPQEWPEAPDSAKLVTVLERPME